MSIISIDKPSLPGAVLCLIGGMILWAATDSSIALAFVAGGAVGSFRLESSS